MARAPQADRPRTPPAARAAVRGAALAIGVFTVLAAAVSDQRYLVGETALIEAANDVPTAAGWPFRVVMQLGTLWAGLVIAALVALWSRATGPPVAVVLAVLVAFRLDNVLKDVIDRPRPPAVVDGLHVREHIAGYGFPSGHTTMAFAIAAAVQRLLPHGWRWVPWAIASVVGLARMHVGVHWPADVLGGAALGTAIGLAAWALVRTLTCRRA